MRPTPNAPSLTGRHSCERQHRLKPSVSMAGRAPLVDCQPGAAVHSWTAAESEAASMFDSRFAGVVARPAVCRAQRGSGISMATDAIGIGILGFGGFAMFAAQQFAQVPGAALRCIAGTHREASLACARAVRSCGRATCGRAVRDARRAARLHRHAAISPLRAGPRRSPRRASTSSSRSLWRSRWSRPTSSCLSRETRGSSSSPT